MASPRVQCVGLVPALVGIDVCLIKIGQSNPTRECYSLYKVVIKNPDPFLFYRIVAREMHFVVSKLCCFNLIQLFIQLTPKLAGYIFVIRASDAVLRIFDILGGHLGSKRGPPPQNQGPLVGENLLIISEIGRTASLALIAKMYPGNFFVNRMSS